MAYTYSWGLNDLIIFHLCIYLRGFSSYTFVHNIFVKGKSCISRVLISWPCTHVLPGSNNECTPEIYSSQFQGGGDIYGEFIVENMMQYSYFTFGLQNQTFLARKIGLGCNPCRTEGLTVQYYKQFL